MPKFVVLLHETPENGPEAAHWDLMFEAKNGLTTWSLPPLEHSESDGILYFDSFQAQAKRLPDHRTVYLDYEGPITRNRGSVRRIDSGTFDLLEPRRYRVRGNLFRGTFLVEDADSNPDSILLIFERDL